jgi:hypothetical protein
MHAEESFIGRLRGLAVVGVVHRSLVPVVSAVLMR